MRNRPFLNGLFALAAGALILFSSCAVLEHYGTNCKRWAYRTSYRSVCKDYDSNRNCRFWGQESYQEQYCAAWKTKEEIQREKSGYSSTSYYEAPDNTAIEPTPETPESKLIRRATQAGNSSYHEQGVHYSGSEFLKTRLEPFLCTIASSEDIRETLSAMGKDKYRLIKSNALGCEMEYATNEFSAKIALSNIQKGTGWLNISVLESDWPFTSDELADWLSGIGFDIRLTTNTQVRGVADYSPPLGTAIGRPDSIYNYGFRIIAHKKINNNAIYPTLNIEWVNRTAVKKILCRE